jgi:O-antigen/teichoic acid export membrane protein
VAEQDASQHSTACRPASRRIAQLALRGTLWSLIGNYGTQLIGVLSGLVLTALLKPEAFGMLSEASYVVALLNVRGVLGFRQAALQQKESSAALIGTNFALDMGAAGINVLLCAVAAAIFSVSGTANGGMVAAMIMAMTLAEAVSASATSYSLLLERELQFSRASIVALIAAVVAYTSSLSLAFLGFSAASLTVISVITQLVGALGVTLMCRRRLPQLAALRGVFDRALAGRLVRAGISSGVALLAVTQVTQIDNFLIARFVGHETLGFYTRAYSLSNWPNLILALVIGRIGFVTFIRVIDDAPRLAHAVRLCVWALLVLGLPIMLLLVFGAPYLVRGLYGETYIESVRYLRFMGVVNFAWPLINVGFWLAAASGLAARNLRMALIQLAILVLLGAPLTLVYGVFGTMAAVALALAAGLAICMRFTLSRTGLRVGELFAWPLVTAGLTALALYGLTLTPFFNDYTLGAGLGGFAYRTPWLLRAGMLALATFVLFWGLYAVLQRAELRERVGYLRAVWRG